MYVCFLVSAMEPRVSPKSILPRFALFRRKMAWFPVPLIAAICAGISYPSHAKFNSLEGLAVHSSLCEDAKFLRLFPDRVTTVRCCLFFFQSVGSSAFVTPFSLPQCWHMTLAGRLEEREREKREMNRPRLFYSGAHVENNRRDCVISFAKWPCFLFCRLWLPAQNCHGNHHP